MAAGLPRAGPRVGAGDHAEDDAALVAGAEIAGIRMDHIAAQPHKRLLRLGQIQLSRAEQLLNIMRPPVSTCVSSSARNGTAVTALLLGNSGP